MAYSPTRTGNELVDRNLDHIATQLNPLLAGGAPLAIGGTVQVYRPYTAKSPLVMPTDWVTVGATGAPAFGAGWADIAVPAAYGVVGYRKDFSGNVWLRGYALNTTGGALGTTVYTLPSGFRPSGGAVFTSGGAALVYITSAGLVAPNVAIAGGAFFGTWCSFECADRSPWVPSCFPFDAGAWTLGSSPTCVLAQCSDVSNATTPSNLAISFPDWTMRTSGGKTVLTIRNIPGLLPSTNYSVNVVAF